MDVTFDQNFLWYLVFGVAWICFWVIGPPNVLLDVTLGDYRARFTAAGSPEKLNRHDRYLYRQTEVLPLGLFGGAFVLGFLSVVAALRGLPDVFPVLSFAAGCVLVGISGLLMHKVFRSYFDQPDDLALHRRRERMLFRFMALCMSVLMIFGWISSAHD